jgi:hypothetical protein
MVQRPVVAAWARDRRSLVAVFGLGLLARAVLIPLAHGQDFDVWDKASAASLSGVDVYVHHPDYPGGPYAYFPLFLYIELPMQWLAIHTGMSFTVLGKLPILAGDLATAVLIGDATAARGGSRRAVTVAVGAFFLNPLVLYNSAYYGRFDSLGCAFLLLAVRQFRRRGNGSASGVGWYALAVAVKTFPGFAAAGVFRATRGVRVRAGLVIGAVLGILLVPYLGSIRAVVRDVIGYDLVKTPQGLSWQAQLVTITSAEDARLIGYLLLALFLGGAIWLSRTPGLDRCVLLTLLLFLCLSKVVLEQYLTWPLPWLAIAALAPTAPLRRSSAALLAILTIIGSLDNESFHPFGRSSVGFGVLLLVACLGYLAASSGVRLREVADHGAYPGRVQA